MVHYMVAMDFGESAKVALFTTLELMKPQDRLWVACIVQDTRMISSYKYPSYMPSHLTAMTELENTRKKYKDLLKIVAHICESRKIHYATMVAVATNVGEMLCQLTDKLMINYLIMGRRSGAGTISRVLLGSTSKYCTENCKCAVIIKKESKLPDVYQKEWSAAQLGSR